MSEKTIIVVFGLLFLVPLTLIFWAHIYLALKDIFASAIEARRAATGNTDAVADESATRQGDAQ